MAEVPAEILEKIKKFAEELGKDNIKIKELFLYGSRSRGDYNELSDIDIAVVSDDFSGIRFIDYDRFIDSILKVDPLIEPIAFRTEDAEEDLFFINEIQNKGIRII